MADHKDEKKKELLAWLTGKMYVEKISDEQMAKTIRCHPRTFANKKKNGNFDYMELVSMFSVLHAEPDIINNLMTY